MQKRAWKLIGMVLAGCGLWASVAISRANGRAAALATGASEIGGAVASAKGPEAGVWVIAETSDLGTKFRKIVVTDERGQFLLPELPKANYKVWVRGYGLVDSAAGGCYAGENFDVGCGGGADSRAQRRNIIRLAIGRRC